MSTESRRQSERLEGDHGWWRARRALVWETLRRLDRAPHRQSLIDIDCGAGRDLALFKDAFEVCGLEASAALAAAARGYAGVDIREGRLGAAHPLAGKVFDRVVLSDVLQRIDDDRGALRQAVRMTAAGGRLVINVPASPALWSVHDEAHHHKRRYTKESLGALLHDCGLECEVLRYWNFMLLPFIWLSRKFMAQPKVQNYEVGIPPAFVNALLERIISAEYRLTGDGGPPVGTSLLAVARRA